MEYGITTLNSKLYSALAIAYINKLEEDVLLLTARTERTLHIRMDGATPQDSSLSWSSS
jgi:hypothetical protein